MLPENSSRGKTYNPLFPALKDLLTNLKELAEQYSATPAQIATAWAIGRGTIPILGVTKVEQVRDAAQVAQITLTPEEVSQLEELAIASAVDTRGGWEGQA